MSDTFDVVVYGATPAGITAAARAARDGASVALVDPLDHVGGMMSSGLCTAEFEHMLRESYGGFALEVYTRIGAAYGLAAPVFHWEPHVAETIFLEIIADAGIRVLTGRHVTDVPVVDGRIAGVVTSADETLSATVFIDASYEGDLAASAGASMTSGRESRDEYGESLAGVTFVERSDQVEEYRSQVPDDTGLLRSADAVVPVSAYDNDGVLRTGFVEGHCLRQGDADSKTANYHYRVTLSTAPDRVSIEVPEDYDPETYRPWAEWLRVRSSDDVRDLFDIGNFAGGRYQPAPDGRTRAADTHKWEANSRQDRPLSLGYLGGQFGYATALPGERSTFWRAHRTHAQGLLHFLSTDTSVPPAVRRQLSAYGLPADEYADNGHWPYALYVREARRLQGERLFTQHDVVDPRRISDSIGLASHWIDGHYVQRVAVPGGFRGEGRIWRAVRRSYQMPYGLMLPRREEVRNLLVPVCVSASHVAFSSLRVEPQWMALGEAAGAAAVLALAGIDVHDVSLPVLQNRLSTLGRDL